MSLIVMIALGLVPWAIAVERLIRGRNRDLDMAGMDRPNSLSHGGTTVDTENTKLLADDTLFGAIISDTSNPANDPSGPLVEAASPQQRATMGASAAAATTKEATQMATNSLSRATPPAHQWPRISPDLAIIDDFVAGDDMLELTLDEAEVAAAERAGVKLDIRVERSSTGRGSLITVGGTPLAFVRGSTHVTPRDVVLRVDRLN